MNRKHLKSFAIIYVTFTVIIGILVSLGADKTNYLQNVLLTTLGSITGPMIGAIAREFQGCCLEFSLSVLKIALPILFFGIAVQFIKTESKKKDTIKLCIWCIAWISWFVLGILTFGHALV